MGVQVSLKAQMFETHQKGELAQLMVQARAVQKGFITSKPTVEARYDLVIDILGKLERTQIKYADSWVTDESLYLDLRKETRNNGRVKLY